MIKKDKYIVLFYAYKKKIKSFKDKTKSCQKCYQLPQWTTQSFWKTLGEELCSQIHKTVQILWLRMISPIGVS